MSNSASILLTLPELILSIGVLALLMVAAFVGDRVTVASGLAAAQLGTPGFKVSSMSSVERGTQSPALARKRRYRSRRTAFFNETARRLDRFPPMKEARD